MRLNFVEYYLAVISARGSLDLFCQRCELIDWIGNFLSESKDQCPYQDEKHDTTADDYCDQILELKVDFLFELYGAGLLLI
jgi:hypothetical protein